MLSSVFLSKGRHLEMMNGTTLLISMFLTNVLTSIAALLGTMALTHMNVISSILLHCL